MTVPTARELTKSMMTAAWAVSITGLRQGLCLFMRAEDAAAVSDAVYHAGDNLQRGVVDLVFIGAALNVFDDGSREYRSPSRQQRPGEPTKTVEK